MQPGAGTARRADAAALDALPDGVTSEKIVLLAATG
jgi:hypothetical protein